MGFGPVIDEETRILIMGSYPGQESLRKRQYYGHPRNQFWRLLGDIIGSDLQSLAYDKRLKVVLSRGIGIWDVFESVEREGSLDSEIRKHVQNDFSILKGVAPRLERVCFNGKKAYSQSSHLKGYKVCLLPSSSPANAVRYDKKLYAWKRAITG